MQERSTGERHTGKNDERGVAPAPAPADVGIVAAMPMEVGDLVNGLKKVWKYQSVAVPVIEGEYRGKIIAVAIGGMGRAAARRAAEVLIAGHRPRWLISAGFAGALNPAYARNDLIVAREVIDREGGSFLVDAAAGDGSERPARQGAAAHRRPRCPARGRQGRAAPFLPGRPGRHGELGRGGGLPVKRWCVSCRSA